MAIKLPARDFFSFSELMTRWQCTENDLRGVIQECELTPKMNIACRTFYMPNKDDYFLVQAGFLDELKEPLIECPSRGWHYLKLPRSTAPFEVFFPFCTEKRTAQKPHDPDDPTVAWFCLNPPMTLTEVVIGGVFVSEDVFEFERKHAAKDKVLDSEEKPLSRKERNTLLTIIAVLCKEAKLDYTTASKTADMIESTADSMGVFIGKTAIRDHLKKIPDALGTRTR